MTAPGGRWRRRGAEEQREDDGGSPRAGAARRGETPPPLAQPLSLPAGGGKRGRREGDARGVKGPPQRPSPATAAPRLSRRVAAVGAAAAAVAGAAAAERSAQLGRNGQRSGAGGSSEAYGTAHRDRGRQQNAPGSRGGGGIGWRPVRGGGAGRRPPCHHRRSTAAQEVQPAPDLGRGGKRVEATRGHTPTAPGRGAGPPRKTRPAPRGRRPRWRGRHGQGAAATGPRRPTPRHRHRHRYGGRLWRGSEAVSEGDVLAARAKGSPEIFSWRGACRAERKRSVPPWPRVREGVTPLSGILVFCPKYGIQVS